VTGKKWLNSMRPVEVRDDEEDEVCPWEEEGIAAAGDGVARERGGDLDASIPPPVPLTLRRPRGRPPGRGGGGGVKKNPMDISEKDLTVLRLGAHGIFNISFDANGHVILP